MLRPADMLPLLETRSGYQTSARHCDAPVGGHESASAKAWALFRRAPENHVPIASPWSIASREAREIGERYRVQPISSARIRRAAASRSATSSLTRRG